MRTVSFFKAKKFHWLGLSKQPSLGAKVRRVAGQFLPWSYEHFDWRLTSGVATPRARRALPRAHACAGRTQDRAAACCASCRCWS